MNGITAYVGQTRSKWLLAFLTYHGYGESTQRGELPPRRQPWFFDNGAYRDHTHGIKFEEAAFRHDIAIIRTHEYLKPDFIVVPDIVAGGLESLDFSHSWVKELRSVAPCYLAVQDGMEHDMTTVGGCFTDYDGLFIGGTKDWKLKTAEMWVQWAHKRLKPAHIGRIGNGRRVEWAKRIGANSIDSCGPLWSQENMRSFHAGVQNRQIALDEWSQQRWVTGG